VKSPTTESSASPVTPENCPFCKSTDISAPKNKVNASTYWRCESCGQMWNVARHQEFRQPSRWNRSY
jgi:transposase-like protein